ncbi:MULTISPECIES: 23S rRNA (guanosine(2251)-2'-O)-methyltransferase RlmB [unclassified Moraxella]|uniref:23S rRNA (guanosine(2251)-2'-O)-methyltransferase RlmB n=1 Tax=unclassified Moraxella TaxID=2685852 RepID=UPI00359D977F
MSKLRKNFSQKSFEKKDVKPHKLSKSNIKSTAKTNKQGRIPHFYGIHAVRALLKHRSHDVLTLFVQLRDDGGVSQTHDELIEFAKNAGVSVQMTHKDRLAELCDSHQHQGVVAAARLPQLYDEHHLASMTDQGDVLFLVLDQITDAHNLGACLRSASAMGVDAVIIPKHQSVSITPTVAKVSVGAAEVVPVIAVTNLARSLELLKKAGVFVFGTALDDTAKPLYDCDFSGKVAIIMGSEGDGMRRLTQEHCDTLVYIPMADNPDRPQSLNVSVATGMALYEVARQRAGRG